MGLCAQACSSTALPAGALLRKSHLQVGGQSSEKTAGNNANNWTLPQQPWCSVRNASSMLVDSPVALRNAEPHMRSKSSPRVSGL